MRVAAVIVLLSEERAQLTQWARSKTVSVRLARRAQIVLSAADGLDNETIGAQLLDDLDEPALQCMRQGLR